MTYTPKKYSIKCLTEGCSNYYYARGLCKNHYKQLLGKEGGYIRDYIRLKEKPNYKIMKKEADKKYRDRLKNSGTLSEKQHKYYLNFINNKENVKKKAEYAKNYYKNVVVKNTGKNAAFSRRYRDIIKDRILRHYSNDKLECANCGINIYSVLTIDHINNNGADHKRRLSKNGKASSTKIYKDIIDNNFPDEYQVLCFNCNFHKEFMRKC